MKGIRWSRLLVGILASALFAVLSLGAIVLLVIAFGSAETLQDVQNLDRYSFIVSVMVGLSSAWGAYIALRGTDERMVLHGLLIGLGVGIINFLINPAPVIGNVLTLLMALPAGVFGSRVAEKAGQRRQQ